MLPGKTRRFRTLSRGQMYAENYDTMDSGGVEVGFEWYHRRSTPAPRRSTMGRPRGDCSDIEQVKNYRMRACIHTNTATPKKFTPTAVAVLMGGAPRCSGEKKVFRINNLIFRVMDGSDSHFRRKSHSLGFVKMGRIFAIPHTLHPPILLSFPCSHTRLSLFPRAAHTAAGTCTSSEPAAQRLLTPGDRFFLHSHEQS